VDLDAEGGEQPLRLLLAQLEAVAVLLAAGDALRRELAAIVELAGARDAIALHRSPKARRTLCQLSAWSTRQERIFPL
jgi:hypothetical protein